MNYSLLLWLLPWNGAMPDETGWLRRLVAGQDAGIRKLNEQRSKDRDQQLEKLRKELEGLNREGHP